MAGFAGMHIGRSWPGMQPDLEDECPCPQEPCGLIAVEKIDPNCPQHGRGEKTIRASHLPEHCPGKRPPKPKGT